MKKYLLIGVYEPEYASLIGLELQTKQKAEAAKRWQANTSTYLVCLPIPDRPGFVRDPKTDEVLELKNRIFMPWAWEKFLQEVWG